MNALTKKQVGEHLQASLVHIVTCKYCNTFFMKTLEAINAHRLEMEKGK